MLVFAASAGFSQIMNATNGPITAQTQRRIAPESGEDLGSN